jgi:predicted enzyme related to lactoylglutathione lyase
VKVKNTSEMIDLKGIAPLLQVFDMPKSLKFYRDVMGLHVVQSSGEGDDVDWVLLRGFDIDLMLNTAYEKPERPEKPDPQRIEAHSDTILFFGCPDLDAAYRKIKEKGLEVNEPEITGYGWKALNIIDPDGYHVCMHWPMDQ